MLEINNTTKIKVNGKKLQLLAEAFVRHFKVSAKEISLGLVGDARMKQLNRDYRGKDQPTDVLSFSEVNEIIIDLPQLRRQAKEAGRSFQFELDFVLVHGLLHLLGYSDATEKGRREMISLGEDFLSKIWYNRKVKYEA